MLMGVRWGWHYLKNYLSVVVKQCLVGNIWSGVTNFLKYVYRFSLMSVGNFQSICFYFVNYPTSNTIYQSLKSDINCLIQVIVPLNICMVFILYVMTIGVCSVTTTLACPWEVDLPPFVNPLSLFG